MVKNNQDVLERLKHVHLDNDDILVSFDVVSMFTKIETPKACEIIHTKLLQDLELNRRTSLSAKNITDLLKLSMEKTAFSAGGSFFRQKSGTAMGKSYSPVAAEIFMQEFERIALSSARYKPKIWIRYVDDVFLIWPHGREKLLEFLEHLNSVPTFSCIQFTLEIEEENKLPFLDILFERCGAILRTTVYRKPTNSGLFLKKSSLHHPSQKLSSISALTHRARSVCSDQSDFKIELGVIRSQFLANGFSSSPKRLRGIFSSCSPKITCSLRRRASIYNLIFDRQKIFHHFLRESKI